MEVNNVPLDTYCADPTCSPSHPCAACTTVPVRSETMAEVVYGAGWWMDNCDDCRATDGPCSETHRVRS